MAGQGDSQGAGQQQAPRVPFQPGDLLDGKYRIERILGEGGMGIVLAATHRELGSAVAIKLVRAEAARHPEALARFQREARIAAQLRGDHVARVTDVGALPAEHGGLPYMVLEYLEGTDLAVLLKQRGPLPIDEAVGYVFEACEAVDEAHALGIVHRDLKPGNLFLARRPRGKPSVKVLDFGISSVTTGEADVRLTGTGAVMGTPRYMAPEQMLDAHRADQRSDIWALGVILYELLTGGPPFPGNTFGLIHQRMLTTEAESVRRLRPDVPADLDAAILRCLRKPQAERFQTIAELEQALRPFLVPLAAGATPRPIVFGPPPVPVVAPAEVVVSMLDRTGVATTGVLHTPTVPGAPAPAFVPTTVGPPTTPLSWNHAGAAPMSALPAPKKVPLVAILGVLAGLSVLVLVAVLIRVGSSDGTEARPAITSSETAAPPVLSASAAEPAAATPLPSASASVTVEPGGVPAPPAAAEPRPSARVAAPGAAVKPAPRGASEPPSRPAAPKAPAKSGIASER